ISISTSGSGRFSRGDLPRERWRSFASEAGTGRLGEFTPMAILPGWNSLDAAGSIAHNLHIAAMVVLALLVIAEGMALVYNDRKYALIGAAERDITARRDQEQQEAEERHHNEIEEPQRRLQETQPQQ